MFSCGDYEKVKQDVWEENWKAMRLYSVVALVAFGVITLVSVFSLSIGKFKWVEMSRNVQSGNTQNLKSMVIQRSFPKWSVAERRKTAAASDQAAVCACAHSRYFTGGSPSGLRV